MLSNLDKYKQDLARLVAEGSVLLKDLLAENQKDAKSSKEPEEAGKVFRSEYELWYSEALEVVRQILPNRLDDFREHYKRDKRKELTVENYTVEDYLLGLAVMSIRGLHKEPAFDTQNVAFSKFQQQVLILNSAQSRFESTLLDIRQILQADVLDSEIAQARELNQHGFLRAAGAIAGVALEKHLQQVSENRKVAIKKKNPTIADFNDKLKDAGVVEVPDWRFIQRLGDLRNLCDHNKQREPKGVEVTELIDGCEKMIKSLF